MKTNLAHKYDTRFFPLMDETQTVGSLVEDVPCLCVSTDCPIETVLAMMAHMETRTAAVIDNGNVYHGLVNRSSLLGGLMINSDFDVGSPIDTAILKKLTAADVMTTSIPFLASELSVHDAIELMSEYGFTTMPVLKENAQFVGIAEMRDLISAHQSSGDNLFSLLSDKRHTMRSLASH